MVITLAFIIPSALVSAAYAYLVLHREAALKKRIAHAALRFGLSFICYPVIYLASILALSAIYLAFDWYSGSITAHKIQFITVSLFASLSSIFVATRRF